MLVLDSLYHRLNSIPPEMSMARPPRNSVLALGPDCSWISWSHQKAQVTPLLTAHLGGFLTPPCAAATPLVILQKQKGIEGFSQSQIKLLN